MNFDEGKKYFSEGLEILKLKGHTMEKVAKDEKATAYAVLFFAIYGLAAAIGTLNPIGIVVMPIFALIGSFIGVGIMHLLAKLFGGKAGFMEYYRVAGIGIVGMWIAVIPIIGPLIVGLVGLYYLVVQVVALKHVHKLSTMKAIIVIAIPVVIGIIVGLVLAAAMVAMMATMGGLGGLGNI